MKSIASRLRHFSVLAESREVEEGNETANKQIKKKKTTARASVVAGQLN